MADTGRYGAMKGPEVSGPVEYAADSARIVSATYELFRPIAREIIGGKKLWYDKIEPVERIYREACRLFEGQEIAADGEKVIEILRRKARPYDGTGLFLSAFLNKADTDELFIDGLPPLDFVGYRIGKRKMLLLGANTKSEHAGLYGRGIVLNWGNLSIEASEAECGFQGNLGTVSTMASLVEGGFHANWGYVFDFAPFIRGGVHVNFGTVGLEEVGSIGSHRGVYINLGKTDYEHTKDLKIKARIYLERQLANAKKLLTRAVDRRLAGLDSGLRKKLLDIDFLKKAKEPTPEVLERVRAFDFSGFSEEISAMGKEMEEYVRRKYGR